MPETPAMIAMEQISTPVGSSAALPARLQITAERLQPAPAVACEEKCDRERSGDDGLCNAAHRIAAK
jgi:hypothetical protein